MLDVLLGDHGEVGYLISIVVDEIIQGALVILCNFIGREKSRHDETEVGILRRITARKEKVTGRRSNNRTSKLAMDC